MTTEVIYKRLIDNILHMLLLFDSNLSHTAIAGGPNG